MKPVSCCTPVDKTTRASATPTTSWSATAPRRPPSRVGTPSTSRLSSAHSSRSRPASRARSASRPSGCRSACRDHRQAGGSGAVWGLSHRPSGLPRSPSACDRPRWQAIQDADRRRHEAERSDSEWRARGHRRVWPRPRSPGRDPLGIESGSPAFRCNVLEARGRERARPRPPAPSWR
jgi:hypothetical protein